METNFTEIKAGFETYLENLYGKSEVNKENGQESLNLFDYNEELKDYLFNELNLDPNSLEGSFSEILDKALVQNVNSSKDGENNFVTEYLFDLLKDNDFIKTIDLNGDNKLDNDEIKQFMEYISVNDNNIENISYNDIYEGVNQVKNGEYIQTQLENGNISDENANKILNNLQNENIQNVNNSETAIQTNNVSNAPAANNISGGEPNIKEETEEQVWVAGQTSLAGKTEEELQKMKAEKQEKADEERNKLNSIFNGSDSGVKLRETNVQNAYEVYMRRLEEEKVDKAILENMINNIEVKEAEIDSKELEISNQEATVSKNENTYNSAVSTRENLESALSALQGASSDDPEEQAAIDAQIAALEGQVQAARTAEEQAKEELENSKEKLEALEGEKDNLEGELETLNAEKEQFEASILQQIGPNIAEAMNNFNNAKNSLNEYKQTAAQNAKTRIDAAQNEVSEIEKVITDNKNRSASIEFSPNIMGKNIVQEALKYLDYNEANGKADEFLYKWHSSSRQTGWCAAFVSYVMEQVSKNTNSEVPNWYQEIENQYWQVNVHRAAEKAGALIEQDQAQSGDIVLFDYDGDGTMQHIGIVYAIEGNTMYTIEGNSGNRVKVNEYDLTNPKNQNITYVNMTK